MTARSPSVVSLVLWPTVITAIVNIARLVFELQGSVNADSGGGGALLGITWLAFAFGAWFAWRLRRNGSHPRLRPAWLWTSLALVGLIALVAWQFGGIDLGDRSEAAYTELRSGVLTIVAMAIPLSLVTLLAWPKLGIALLVYAIPARATVVAVTWLAKRQGWDTHYTKFGPAGIERDMAESMLAASVAQLGFWIPFTVIGGMAAGSIVTARMRRTAAN